MANTQTDRTTNTQLFAVRNLMLDGNWRTLGEIRGRVGFGSESSISARLRDLRKDRFGGYNVETRRIPNSNGLYEYRVTPSNGAPRTRRTTTTTAKTVITAETLINALNTLNTDELTTFVDRCLDNEDRANAVLAAVNKRGVFIRALRM